MLMLSRVYCTEYDLKLLYYTYIYIYIYRKMYSVYCYVHMYTLAVHDNQYCLHELLPHCLIIIYSWQKIYLANSFLLTPSGYQLLTVSNLPTILPVSVRGTGLLQGEDLLTVKSWYLEDYLSHAWSSWEAPLYPNDIDQFLLPSPSFHHKGPSTHPIPCPLQKLSTHHGAQRQPGYVHLINTTPPLCWEGACDHTHTL